MSNEQRPYIQLTLAVKHNSPADVSHWVGQCSKHQCTQALVYASTLGHQKCIKELLPHAQEFSRALWAAMDNKRLQCVKMLLPVVKSPPSKRFDFRTDKEETYCLLEHAVNKNLPTLIPTVLPYIETPERNNCLALAFVLNRPKCIERLLFVADFAAATKILNTSYNSHQYKVVWEPIFERYASVYQARVLKAHIGREAQTAKSSSRKI